MAAAVAATWAAWAAWTSESERGTSEGSEVREDAAFVGSERGTSEGSEVREDAALVRTSTAPPDGRSPHEVAARRRARQQRQPGGCARRQGPAWHAPRVLKQFRDFVTRVSVVELAVAVVIALALVNLLRALVIDVVTPLLRHRRGSGLRHPRPHGARLHHPLRRLPQRADRVPDHRGRRLLRRRQAPGRLPASPGRPRTGRRAVPALPVHRPRGRQPLPVLHLGPSSRRPSPLASGCVTVAGTGRARRPAGGSGRGWRPPSRRPSWSSRPCWPSRPATCSSGLLRGVAARPFLVVTAVPCVLLGADRRCGGCSRW